MRQEAIASRLSDIDPADLAVLEEVDDSLGRGTKT
jgi:hypothetical protein